MKYLHIHRNQLAYKNKLLYYIWSDNLGDKLLFVVPGRLKEEVVSLNQDLHLTGRMGTARAVA